MDCTFSHLCEAERYMIVNGLRVGHSIRHIARNLQQSASSISRELRINIYAEGYNTLLAHQKAKAKRFKPRIKKISSQLEQVLHSVMETTI